MADDQEPGGADDDSVSLREVFKVLQQGQSVEIKVGDDQEFKRRQRQIERRAEKQGIPLVITREVGAMRLSLAQAAPAAAAPAPAEQPQRPERPERADRPERPERADREERRAQRRAERAAQG